jgi:threonine/homoserine/homoserine lactone efflux protein
MELSALLAFAGVAATLIVLPGPDWALVLAAGTRARGTVVPAVAGLAIGYVLITAVVAAGVAPVVAAAPVALSVLTFVGAAYLVYVGFGILRGNRSEQLGHGDPPTTNALHAVWRGVGVSALNPKSLLFFLAFLPQFAQPSAPWPLAAQLAVLGGVWIALAATFYTALGRIAHRTLAARPTLARTITRLAGVAMVLAGVALVAKQLIH